MATRPKRNRRSERPGRILAELLSANRAALSRQATLNAARADDAEDAIQDACLGFMRAYDGPPGEPALRYLMTCVKHSAWALAGCTPRRRECGFEDFVRTGDHAPCDLAELLPDPDPAPLDLALERELLAERRERLAALKPDQRIALVMFALGCSYREIGERRGWTKTKVNRCLAEGRAALRAREQA